MTQSFLMQLGSLDYQDSLFLQDSFNELKPSEYKDGAYRLRKYSKLALDTATNKLKLLPSTAFIQAGELNQFQGDIARSYDDLSEQIIKSQAMTNLCQTFMSVCQLPKNCTIEVHQMRIIAQDDDTPAEATPEGIHQDGFDFVGVFTINRHNDKGGALLLWQDKNQDTPLAKLTPKPADYCIINDKKLWHSASAVDVVDTSDVGYWDLFVLTANVDTLPS